MIYSPGRNTIFIHQCQHCMNTDVKIIESGNELPMQKYNVLTLLAADSAVSRLEWVENTFSTRFLHCCWVSTAALLWGQDWNGLAWVVRPPHAHFPGLAPCIPGSRHFPDTLSGAHITFPRNAKQNKEINLRFILWKTYNSVVRCWTKAVFLGLCQTLRGNTLVDSILQIKIKNKTTV